MSDKFIDLMRKNWREEFPQQGMVYEPTTLFGVKPQARAIGAPAGVEQGVTDTIDFHPGYTKKAPSYTVMHEMEHILDNKARNRYNDQYFNVQSKFEQAVSELLGLDTSKASTVGQIGNSSLPIQRNLAKQVVVDRFKKLGLDDAYTTNINPEDITKRGMSYAPLNEVFASLSGWENAKGKDITQDPVIRKELFNDDPVLIEAYKAVTGLRKDRLDAKDPAPFTPDKSKIPPKKGIKEVIVDLFKDPFGDTTK